MLAFLVHSLLAGHVQASSPSFSFNARSDSSTVATAWYAGWHATAFPLSNVSWSKYTQMTYAFAVTTPDVNTLSLEASDEELLPQFVQAAHSNNVKASLSIGGWTGSLYYSTNVGSAQNRTAFVKTVTGLVKKYGLDGLDFDWEYPNRQGVGCNTINSNDTANFLSFLQELRQDPLGANLTLSAATSIQPWNDASGSPSTDLSGFSQVLDYIAIMNYDVWTTGSSSVGPNSPLNDTCSPTLDQKGSAVSAVKAWTDAGIPPSQIVLGVAAYGHSFVVPHSNAFISESSNTLAVYPPFNASAEHVGDAWDSFGGVGICGEEDGPSGVYSYWGLVDGGYIYKNGTVKSGIEFRYDDCTQTPYVYDTQNQTMISYDDTKSFAAKGNFIKSNGLRGFAMWEAAGDLDDTLLDSISSAITQGSSTNITAQPLATTSSSSSINSGSSTRLCILSALLWIYFAFASLH